MTENIFLEKKNNSKILKDFFKLKNKPTGLIIVENEENIDFLLDGLEQLSCDFVIKTKSEMGKKINIIKTNEISKDFLSGFDFVVTDNKESSLQQYLKNGITPIVPENNYLSSILKEFNPLTSEGNSFLYKENNSWSMYYAIIRYLENYKFPYDNRNLVKNIIKT
ncbi:hypothetical protein H3C61_03845 [Candidatus Gracilibacteria bacterium]|nr:hypothetical protein [Candidatus Gracilibacteria bacterium]